MWAFGIQTWQGFFCWIAVSWQFFAVFGGKTICVVFSMSLLLPWLLNLKWSQAIYWVLALDEFDDRQASDLWWC